MKTYDYCLMIRDDTVKTLEMAKTLGFSGLCFLTSGVIEKNKTGLDLAHGMLIKVRKSKDIKKTAIKNRKNFEIIAVRGIDEEMNRFAVETPEVDMLMPAEKTRIDHVMAKIAKKNNVSITFEFTHLLEFSRTERGKVFHTMKENARLVRKYKVPFVITSGALTLWDLRSPSELSAFAKLLGFNNTEIKDSYSEKLLNENRLRLGGKWIAPGVEVE